MYSIYYKEPTVNVGPFSMKYCYKLYLTFSRLCYEKEEVVIDQLHHLNLGQKEELLPFRF